MAALLLASGTPAQAREPASGLAMVDLTGNFDAFWQQTQGLETPARVQAFYAEMEQRLPGFFRASRVGVDQARYDRHIADGFAACSTTCSPVTRQALFSNSMRRMSWGSTPRSFCAD